MTIKKTKLMLQFESETGKNAIWRGKITANFKKWAAQQQKKGKVAISTSITQPTISSNISSTLEAILNKFQDFEKRLLKLENTIFKTEPENKIQEITDQQLIRTINIAYHSLEKRFGDFVSISALTNKIQDFIPWTNDKIHDELYKLFMEYKVDLQPGKIVQGEPLVKDGQTFVWFKLKKI